MAISARLLGKEIHRKKLRWFDLRRANYRLGKKIYESQLALPEDNRIIDRVNKIQDRIETLRQPVNSGSSFKERAKAVAKGGARFMKIQILKFKRARALRMLGAQTREEQPSHASLVSEIEAAKAVSDRIQTNDADIRELAPRTYLWARKPLATVSIVIAASLLCAGITHQRALAAPDVSTPKKAVQAFLEALERNDMATARVLGIGSEQLLADAKEMNDLTVAFRQMAIATAEKFEGEDKAKEASREDSRLLAEASAVIEHDKATVSIGWGGTSFTLQKEGNGWKISLGQSSYGIMGKELLASGPQIRKIVEETTGKIRKGHYKSKNEVDHDLRVKLAPLIAATEPKSSPAPSSTTPRVASSDTPRPQSVKSRSETSLAVERYLRLRLVGGATENQIVELSDAIATKFKEANLTASCRAACIKDKGGQPEIDLKTVYEFSSGDGPDARETKRLIREIDCMIPPRAVFKGGLYIRNPSTFTETKKPLPPLEERIGDGYRSAGSLAQEFFMPLSAIIDRYYPHADRERLLNETQSLKDPNVLICHYQDAATDLSFHAVRFWYKTAPEGLGELLKTLPADHTIRLIGPARENAPDSHALALQANRATGALAKKQEEDQAERKKKAGGGFLDYLAKMAELGMKLGQHEKEQERQHYERVEQIIAESGGKKIKCPACNGSRTVLDSTYNHQTNPHPYLSLEHGQFEKSRESVRLIACNRCNKTGVVDK